MVHRTCPNCRAGKPHSQSQDLNAFIFVKKGAIQKSMSNPVSVFEAKATQVVSEMRGSADMLNVVDFVVMAPQSKDSISRVKRQCRVTLVRNSAPSHVPAPSRISAKGGIQRSVPPSAHRQSSRRPVKGSLSHHRVVGQIVDLEIIGQ